MGEIANQTIEGAKKSEKVVLSHATYRQSYREYFVDKLVQGGAKRENITVVQLMIDPEVKIKGLYYRSKEQCEMGGITIGDSLRTQGWDGEGDATCAEYMAFVTKTYPSFFPSNGNGAYEESPSGYGKTVDVSGRDITHLDGVDEALGLVGQRNNKTLSFVEIRDKVKVLDQKRDEDMTANGVDIGKIFAEASGGSVDDKNKDDDVVAIDTEEHDKIVQRRSSLISVEYLERELRCSLESSSDEKKNVMKARRSSLIKTGRIE